MRCFRVFFLIVVMSYSFVYGAVEIFPWKVFVGDQENSAFGWSLCGADINGDNIKDLIVGAPMYSVLPDKPYCGAIFVYLGGSDMDDIPDYVIYGEYARDQFGISVSSAGDFNNDGFEDIVVGANVTRDIGRAYIFLGGASFGIEPFAVFDGEEVVDNYGYAVSGVGDVNLDGYDDIVVGALYNDALGDRTGRAYLYFGSEAPADVPNLIFTGPESLMDFGCYISLPFDYNGDGAPDILIGAPEAGMYWMAPGEALLFFGGALLDNIPDLRCEGENPMDFFGGVLSGIGRFNGDRYDDFAVGAYNNSSVDSGAGRVYIYFGGESISNSPSMIINGHVRNEGFGCMVSTTYDFDGNGFDDLAVAGNYNVLTGDTVGTVFIYSGGVVPDTIFDYYAVGESSDDRFGWFIAPLGDVNGDGLPDIGVGACGYQNSKGKVYVYTGFRSLVPPIVRIIEPFDGATTSCADQNIVLYYFDLQGIDLNYLLYSINGVVYHFDSSFITVSDSFIIIKPTEPFYDNQLVNFCLEDLANVAGVHIEAPLCLTFTVDLSPPWISDISPSFGAVVRTHQPIFTFKLSDDPSGYELSNFSATVDAYRFVYPDSSVAVVEEKGEFSLVSAGIYFRDMDTVKVEFSGLKDKPDFCEPNLSASVDVKVMVDLTWQAQIYLENGEHKDEIVIGQVREASNRFDPGIDRIYIPGTPSEPNMRISFYDPTYPYIRWLVGDYRSSSYDTATWTVFIDGYGSATLRWNPAVFPEGIFLVNGVVDMRVESLFALDLPETLTLTYRWTPMKKRTIVLSEGWNLVSFPGYPSNADFGELTGLRWLTFYKYNAVERRYVKANRVGPGVGYFVFTPMRLDLKFIGCDAESLIVFLYPGWNLIGGPSFRVPISTLEVIPSTAVDLSSVYEYDRDSMAYRRAESLEIGFGYWIFSAENAVLIMRR